MCNVLILAKKKNRERNKTQKINDYFLNSFHKVVCMLSKFFAWIKYCIQTFQIFHSRFLQTLTTEKKKIFLVADKK